jgi:iron complex outermembrane receptor protein
LNAWRDYAYAHTLYYAPSVTWNLTPSTLLTLQHEWRKGQTNYDRGLVAPANRIDLIGPRTTTYQSPTDYQNEDGRTYSLQFDHTFANDIKYGLTARRVETEDLANGFDNNAAILAAGAPAGSIPTVLQRRSSQIHNKRTSTYWDTNFVIPGKTWGIEHKLIVGAGGGFDTARLTRERFLSSAAYNVSLANPTVYVGDPTTVVGATNALQDRDNGTRSIGVYAADLMTLTEHWKLNLGFRSSDERSRMQALPAPPTTTVTGAQTTKVAKKTLPLAGLLYQPTEQWTFYTSYSTSFVPAAVTAQDVNGLNSFDPEESTQYEVGSKAELMDGRLQPSLAIFQITKKNLLSMFTCPSGIPATGTCSQQVGSQKVQGFELEINARPIEALQVVAGISHIDGKVNASRDPVQVGAKLQNSAADSFHVWTRYDFSTGMAKGFGVGAGLSYVGPRAGNLPVSPTASTPYSAVVMNLPGYTTADLGIYYTLTNWDFSVRISNLFDKTYVEATGATPEVQIQMGAPRQLALSGRYRF